MAMTKSDHMVLGLWNWLVRRIWECVEAGASEALKCCEQSILGHLV